MKKKNWLQIISYRMGLYKDEKVTFRMLVPKKPTENYFNALRAWSGGHRIVYCPFCRQLDIAAEGYKAEDLLECRVCGRTTVIRYGKEW